MAARAPAAEAPPAPPRWYLGFDCATKTFAFSLSRVDLAGFAAGRTSLKARALAAAEVVRRAREMAPGSPAQSRLIAEIAPVIAELDATTRQFIALVDGETADLVPGRPDREIPTVERIKALAEYVERRIRPALAAHIPPGEPMQVLVEFQMGPNAPARTIAAALIAIFAREDVIIVGPSLKGKVYTCEEGRYCYFAQKYSDSYGANKAHAKFNFARIEEAFESRIPAQRPAALRGHIADSFMQVLGHLIYGAGEKAETMF